MNYGMVVMSLGSTLKEYFQFLTVGGNTSIANDGISEMGSTLAPYDDVFNYLCNATWRLQ